MIWFWVLITASVLLEIVGDVCCKWGMNHSSNIFSGVGFGFYLMGSVFWLLSLRYGDLSKVGVIFILLNTILILVSGIFIFHDKLSIIQWVGVVIGVIALVIMNLGGGIK